VKEATINTTRNPQTRESRERPIRRPSRLFVIVSLLALTSLVCQCSPSPSSPSNPYSVGDLGEAEALQALDGANQVFQESFDSNGIPDMVQLLNYLEGNPAFQASGPSPDGSVWTYLTNGRLAIFIPPVQDAPQSTARPAAGLAAPLPVRAAARPGVSSGLPASEASSPILQGEQKFELPSNDLVLIMNGLPWNGTYAFDDVQLALWFTEQKYKVTLPEGGIQVDDLYLKDKGIDYGVFIIATHGGLGCVKPTSVQCPEWLTALATNTRVTAENQKLYADDLDHHRLVYVGSRDDPGTYYAFTGSFITEHMHFADNSLVFMFACSGYNLASAFTAANASVVLGWDTLLSGGSDAQDYFFDRMLGINRVHAANHLTLPEPPNRPFDYVSVYNIMQQTYQDLSYANEDVYGPAPGGGYQKIDEVMVTSSLLSSHGGGSFGILRPTIEHLEVDEENEELTLVGLFGSEQGEVFINGTQLEATWDSEKIVAKLPAADDSDGTGLVYVKVRDHKSNEVPLTLWHVKFTYTEGPDQTIDAYQWLDLDIYWRADIHMYRSLPDGFLSAQGTIPLEPAEASSATWRCQWEGSYAGFSFTTDSGEGSLTLTYDGDPDVFTSDGTFSSTATLDGLLRQIVSLQFIVNYDPETTCKVTTSGGGISDTSAIGFVLLPSLLRNLGDTPALQPLFLEDKYQLTGGNRDLLHDKQWPWFKWDTTPGENPPDDKKTDG
jgi:hypothetical protein